MARILVAGCTGSADLGRTLGLPLFHVDVVVDPEAVLRRLNARAHGAGVLDHASGRLRFEEGWRDWTEIPYPSTDLSADEAEGGDGVICGGGRLYVALPQGATVMDLRLQLRAGLRHLAVREVVDRCAWRARRRHPEEGAAASRITGNGRNDSLEGASDVRDLYALDPVAQRRMLFWRVVAARAATA